MNPELFDFLVVVRRELIAAVNEVEDAVGGYWWEGWEKSNYEIGKDLIKIFNKYSARASSFGVHRVYAHGGCGNEKHDEYEYYYYDEDIGGLFNSREDKRFKYDFIYAEYEKSCICPCSDGNESTRHVRKELFLFDEGGDVAECELIYSVLVNVYRAYENAGDHRQRSGIREKILQAILIINDAVLPFTVDEYIKGVASAGGKQDYYLG